MTTIKMKYLRINYKTQYQKGDNTIRTGNSLHQGKIDKKSNGKSEKSL